MSAERNPNTGQRRDRVLTRDAKEVLNSASANEPVTLLVRTATPERHDRVGPIDKTNPHISNEDARIIVFSGIKEILDDAQEADEKIVYDSLPLGDRTLVRLTAPRYVFNLLGEYQDVEKIDTKKYYYPAKSE